MEKKRAVFLFRNMGTGGAQKIQAFVANALYSAGYEVVAVNMALSPCSVDINSEIKIVNIAYDDVEKCHNRILRMVYKGFYLLKLRRTLLSLKPDVVCAFLSDVVRIAVLALKGRSIPIIGSERGDPYVFTQKQFDNYRVAYSKCKGVVFQLDAVMKKYDLPKDVLQKVIPNPCIPRRGGTFSECLGRRHIIIGAGRLCEQKRFDLLISAFEIVYKEFPNYELQIYGDGPLYQKLVEQAKNSTANSAIKFAGDVDDVFAVAIDAEMFVLSSDFEGIPNVLLEAMAVGLPCISTDCRPGGARFLLGEGKCGIVVPCNDSVALANAIKSYIREPSLRESYRSAALEVVADFLPESIKRQWLRLFEVVLSNQ